MARRAVAAVLALTDRRVEQTMCRKIATARIAACHRIAIYKQQKDFRPDNFFRYQAGAGPRSPGLPDSQASHAAQHDRRAGRGWAAPWIAMLGGATAVSAVRQRESGFVPPLRHAWGKPVFPIAANHNRGASCTLRGGG